jgi:hypothetical protein
MQPGLRAIKAALEELSDAELGALIDATYKAPQVAPGFLAWLDTACQGARPTARMRLRAAATR